MAASGVPLPIPDEDSRPFWEGCKQRRLVMQRCADCGAFRFTPRPMCPRCRSTACEWETMSGRGTVYSRVICHPPVLPAFRDRVPYAVVLVELEEDPALRLVGNVLGASPEDVRIGAPVEVAFEDVSEEIALPQWRLANASRSTMERNPSE